MFVSRFAKTLWSHKKKSAFAIVVAAYGTNALRARLSDDKIRRCFAERALQYGLVSVEPTQRLRRVTVLLNREAGGRRAADRFRRNALPLLNLAGLEVNVVEVSSAAEMESLCRVLDTSEADCVYLVGGDGTLSRALVGLYQNGAPLPVGLFPGGRNNIAFWRLFRSTNSEEGSTGLRGEVSVRLFCESAMALIEGENRRVFPVKCTITEQTLDSSSDGQTVDSPPNTFWLLSDLRAGWFEHCEQKAPKLWFWGPLRYRFVYFWEFLKRKPMPLQLRISFDEFCPGCKHCVVPKQQNNVSTFWSFFTRIFRSSPNEDKKTSSDLALTDTDRDNPNCGLTHETKVSGADVRVSVEQTNNGSKLRLRVGGGEGLGRWAAMRFGWRNCVKTPDQQQQMKTMNSSGNEGNDAVGAANKDTQFYELDIEAGRLELHFTHIPEFVQKLSLAGDWNDFEQYKSKKITLSITKQMGDGQPLTPLHFYVPKMTMAFPSSSLQKVNFV